MEYLVIPKLKLAIEAECVEDLDENEEESISRMINNDDTDFEDIEDIEVNNFTVGNIVTFHKFHKLSQNLSGLDVEKLLLFWLKYKNIEYTIESDISKCKEEGYLVINTDNL